MLVQDLTRGTSGMAYASAGYYNGSSAEWIDERPSYEHAPKEFIPGYLANFSTVNWNEAKDYNFVTGAWQGISAEEHLRLHMMSNNESHQLAAPGLLSSATSFQDNWLACQ